jgi:Cu/Ag efflux protein CusF
MKSLFLFLILTPTVLFAGPALAADQPPAASSPQTVKGEVVIITDEFYLVQDATGKSIQVRLSKTSMDGQKDTKIEGPLKAGDKIEAVVEADGHALTIKKVR